MANSDVNSREVKNVEPEFRSLDGLCLKGTFVIPAGTVSNVALFVHGGGVTRDEGGFFTRLAMGLASEGIASLRFDFRAHGESEGRQEDLTLSGITNDIRAAIAHMEEATGSSTVNLIGASFGGGITAFYASRYPAQVQTLVLLNPLLNYKKRFIDDKPYWTDDRIDAEVGRELAEKGSVAHSPSFKLGRPLLNELFYLQPDQELESITAPTLIVHGTHDTFIPVASSREHIGKIRAATKLLEIEGAQHGFAVHDDPKYLNPQTREWQTAVIRSVREWIIEHR